jgi:cholest-4-en-3-one 26-monooxygenase
VQLSDIDLTDMDRFKQAFPHEWFTFLREEAPVWFHPPTDVPENTEGFWVVTKYDDVVAVSRDWQTFSSEKAPEHELGGVMLPDIGPESGVGTMMLMMDPPQHTRYRKIVSSAFTPRVVRLFEQQVRRRAREIVDAVIERGECDFVTEISAELPLQAIAEILGVPQHDRGKLFDWTNKMVGSSDPEYVVAENEFMTVSTEMFGYANALGAEKRAEPGDDIVTAIVNAEVDGEQLTEFEFDMFFMLLTVAGNETTRNAITHGMLAFFENPDQWALLRDDLSLLDTAAEEIVRWASPVIYFRRSLTHDAELRGHRMKTGDKITLWYPSANRDEDVFDRPFEFDIRRDPNPHIGFGGRGPHFCLGSNLARLEIKVIFEELARRVPDIAPADDPDRLRSNFINGIKHLPVTFSQARRSA